MGWVPEWTPYELNKKMIRPHVFLLFLDTKFIEDKGMHPGMRIWALISQNMLILKVDYSLTSKEPLDCIRWNPKTLFKIFIELTCHVKYLSSPMIFIPHVLSLPSLQIFLLVHIYAINNLQLKIKRGVIMTFLVYKKMHHRKTSKRLIIR